MCSSSTATGAAGGPLTPNRSVAEVTRDVLAAVRRLAGDVEINPKPQETPWRRPSTRTTEHATYDPPGRDLLPGRDPGGARPRGAPRALPRPLDAGQRLVGNVRPRRQPLLRATRRADVAGLHQAQRGNAEQIEVGWWPGDPRYPQAAFFAFAYPPPEGSRTPTSRRGRGTRPSANTSSTGTTSSPPRTRTQQRWISPVPSPDTPVRSATGLPISLPASRESHHPSPDVRPSHAAGAGRVAEAAHRPDAR